MLKSFLNLIRKKLWNSGFYWSCRLNNFSKLARKQLCWSVIFTEAADQKISQSSLENTCVGDSFLIKLQAEKMRKIHKKSPVPRSLVFGKVEGWRHNISSKSIQNLSFLNHLRSVFPYNWKLQYLFKLNSVKSCLVIANKKTQNITRQGPLLKVVKVDGFSFSI